MYSYDTSTNAAIELQRDRVRRVQAYGTRQMSEDAAPSWAADGLGQTRPVARKATRALSLALAASSTRCASTPWKSASCARNAVYCGSG